MEDLRDLASYDFQKVAWFENDQGLCSSFYEDYFLLFDSTSLSDYIDAGEIVFGKEADKALKELQAVCEAIPDKRSYAKDFIDSDEMKIIREMAKRCLKLIDESDGSESTVKYLKAGEPQPD
jgi:hypothetical protein